jgi:hypothetical protein
VSRVPRNALLAGATLLVFVAVAAAVDLQIVFQSHSTQSVWALTQSVVAGDKLTADNVRRLQIPVGGTSLAFYTGDPVRDGRRTEHDMDAGTIVFERDLLPSDVSLVTLSLKTPPPVTHGDVVDVYALVDNRTRIVGRHLAVDTANGSNFSIWVPAGDEPYWITLQANNVALYAAESHGVGVPQSSGQSVADAVASLGGGTVGPSAGSGTTPRSNQQAAVSPSPTPRQP